MSGDLGDGRGDGPGNHAVAWDHAAGERRLVLIGGGHSHLEVLRSLGKKPLPEVRITLIAREVQAPYSGMLPGFIAGHYGFDDIHIDLRPLARFAGAHLVHAEAVGIDAERKQVLCRDHPPVPYDILSINTGSAPRLDDVPGAAGQVIPVKPVDRFIAHWRRLRELTGAGEAPSLHIGVIGAGAGGVEVALSIHYALSHRAAGPTERPPSLTFCLVTDSDRILPSANAASRAILQRILAERGIRVLTGHRVVTVEPGHVHCANGAAIALDRILWVTPGQPAAWARASGLATDERGFIRVADTLQSVSHRDVFAAGDMASIDGEPRPKAGVFAVRHGALLAANLRRALHGRPLRGVTPQRTFLTLISTGDRYAVGARNRWAVEGRWVWWWKDRIDRRFVRRYKRLRG